MWPPRHRIAGRPRGRPAPAGATTRRTRQERQAPPGPFRVSPGEALRALRRPDALGGRPIFIGRRRGSSAAGRDDPRRRPPQARQTILAPSGPAVPRASSDGQRGDAEDDRRARCGAAGPQEDRQVDPDDPPHPERRRTRTRTRASSFPRCRRALVPEHRHSEHRHVVSARSLLGNSAEPSRWCLRSPVGLYLHEVCRYRYTGTNPAATCWGPRVIRESDFSPTSIRFLISRAHLFVQPTNTLLSTPTPPTCRGGKRTFVPVPT